MYKVYIDESGDLGNSFLIDDNKRGSYYFILSAVIIEENVIQVIENAIDETKMKLGKNKCFHFVDDKHVQRTVFLNKIAKLNDKFNSILIAQDKLELVNLCKLAQRNVLTSQEIFEHVVMLLFKEIKYMFANSIEKIEVELIFEENKRIDYGKIKEVGKPFSDQNFSFQISLCNKDCKCIQVADYLAGALMAALDENKFDNEIDESYIDKLIGKLYHYDKRKYANIAALHAYRLCDGPYQHRIKLSSSHAFGKFEMKKQGWAKFIQECF